jgi:predicted helicase
MQAKKIIASSKSWQQLDMHLERLTKSAQSKLAGDVFELVVKHYLETAPQYRTLFKKVYLLKEVPTQLKQKLRLPDTDEGIDIIAETFDKKYYAIQCKYRSDETDTLTRENLTSFSDMAFQQCNNFSHGIVCATVNKPPRKVGLLKNISYQLYETWLGLDDNNQEAFKLIQSKLKGKIIKPKKLSPRPHQVTAIKKTLEHFKSNDRGKMIMPCGTGKSLTAFWIAKQMRAKTVLIAVPSLALLQQTLKVWTREYLIHGVQPEWLCVCSDDTVKEEQDDFVSYTYDLGIKVTTNPKEIKSFLKKKSKLKIIFTTYQSGRMTAQGSKGIKFDLGIMDEAHKTVGSGSKPMAHLIHEKNIKIKHRLFMTATERLFRGDKDEYLSMDDPRDYGKLIYELTFKDAINAKPPIISDYKIVTFGITTPEIEEVYKSNKFLEVKKELKDITAREFATALALRKAIKKLNIKNAISFHRSIKRADNFREQQQLISKIFPEYGKLKSYHVAGNMPTSERANQMRSFSESKGLMTNARCLTEGVDLPAIDCVCFTDPKRSKVDIVQAAGRALRLSKGKKFGYILIPIFVPDHIELAEAAEEQGYDDVAITVRALATSDRRIVEYLRAISEGRKPKGGSPIDGKISINQLHKIEADEFDKAIKLKVWDKVAYGNWRSYEEAREYAQSLRLRNTREWIQHTRTKKFPADIPKTPNFYYKKKFRGYGDFLGTGTITPSLRIYRSFNEAKIYAQSLKLKTQEEWRLHTKSKVFPKDIPSYPPQTYKKEWKFWKDFLGTNYASFEEAKKYARRLKIKSVKEWIQLTKSKNFPTKIPKRPHQKFKKEFRGYGDFLGSGNIAAKDRIFRSFEEAKKYTQSLKLKGFREWHLFTKSKNFPKDIPVAPYRPYKKEWKGWSDFLGKKSK